MRAEVVSLSAIAPRRAHLGAAAHTLAFWLAFLLLCLGGGSPAEAALSCGSLAGKALGSGFANSTYVVVKETPAPAACYAGTVDGSGQPPDDWDGSPNANVSNGLYIQNALHYNFVGANIVSGGVRSSYDYFTFNQSNVSCFGDGCNRNSSGTQVGPNQYCYPTSDQAGSNNGYWGGCTINFTIPSATSGNISVTVTVNAGSTDIASVVATGGGYDSAPALSTTQAIASTTLTVGTAATAFTPVTASGGTTPYTYAVSPSLPAGLSFSTSTGQISGTPTAYSASATYTVTVTDSASATSSKTFDLAVNKAAQTINFPAIADTNYGYIYTDYTAGQHKMVLGSTDATSAGLGASASSGLTLSFATSGPCSYNLYSTGGSYIYQLTFTGVGTCSVTASQLGNSTFAAATDVTRSFNIAKGDQVLGTDSGGGSVTYSSGGTFSVRAWALTGGATNKDANGANSGLLLSYLTKTPSVCTVGTPFFAANTLSYVTVTKASPGTCTVTASQAGDANFNAAADLDISTTITAPALSTTTAVASTTLTVNSAATPFTPVTASGGYGTLTYAVSPALPTGLSFNTATGQITGMPTAISGATNYTITVTDQTSPAQSSSKTFSLTIGKAAQTISFTQPSDTPFVANGAVALVASATSGLAVSFASNSTSVCTISGSNAIMKTTGTCSITAAQDGDATYNAATSVTQTFSITAPLLSATAVMPSTTISVGAAVTPFTPVTASGGTAPLTYAVSPSLPTGLSFSTSTGQITGTPTTATVAANYTVTVTDATAPVQSSQAQFSLTVDKGGQTIAFTKPADQTFAPGAAVALTAAATSGLAVSFASTTTGVCTVSGSTATIVTAGTCSITASQAGSANYNAATDVTQSFAIGKASQTISFTKPADQTFTPGGTVALSATGGASGQPVTFASITTGVCTVSGSAATMVAAGTCSVTAAQAGDASYAAAADVTQSFAIGKASQTISFSKPADQTYSPGGTVALVATATSGLAVGFASTTTGVCTVSGTTATIVAAGTCSVTTSQGGNANYNAAADVVQSFDIGKASQAPLTLSATPASIQIGGTASLATSGGSGTGAVSYAVTGNPSICSVAGSTATALAEGTCALTATKAADSNYNQATATATVAVAKATATVALAASSESVQIGQPVTYRATVTQSGGSTPTGTVTFTANGNTLCAAVPLSGGSASCTTTFATPGTQNVIANYSGSAFSASASAPASATVVVDSIRQTARTISRFVAQRANMIASGQFGGERQIDRLMDAERNAATGTGADSGSAPATGFANSAGSRLGDGPGAADISRLSFGARANGEAFAGAQSALASLGARSVRGDPGDGDDAARGGGLLQALRVSGSADGAARLSFATSLSALRQASAVADQAKIRGAAWAGSTIAFSGGIGSGRGGAAFSPLDIWVEGSYGGFRDKHSAAGFDGHFAMLTAGADYVVNPSFLIGAYARFDDMMQRSDTDQTDMKGRGWMAGPYATLRLAPNMFWQARGAWGRSSNEVSPYLTYVDKFDSSRWLAATSLTGRYAVGAWTLTPSAMVSYFEDRSLAYQDTFGVTIPSVTSRLGQFKVGPQVTYKFKSSTDLLIEPRFGVQVIWNFAAETRVDGLVDIGDAGGPGGVRGRADAGVRAVMGNGIGFDLSGSYDGIGSSSFSAATGRAAVRIPLN